MNYEIVYGNAFRKDIKDFAKHYPSVKEDVRRVIQQLQEAPYLGKVIVGGKGARKIRVDNSDQNKGRSGSYRLIYYVVDQPSKTISLLTMYAKNDREDIPAKEVLRLLKSAGLV